VKIGMAGVEAAISAAGIIGGAVVHLAPAWRKANCAASSGALAASRCGRTYPPALAAIASASRI